jgi:hypothetical protein
MAVFISSHVTWKLVIFKMHVYIYIHHDEFKNSEQPFLELGTQAHHNPMKMISLAILQKRLLGIYRLVPYRNPLKCKEACYDMPCHKGYLKYSV